jgi:Uma2 family endonuclease
MLGMRIGVAFNRHVWLVNPAIHTVEVLRLESQRWPLIGAYEGIARVRAEPFEDLELNLAELWVEGTPACPP